MNIPRRIIYTAGVFSVLTALAVYHFPGVDFAAYAGTFLKVGTGLVLALTAISFIREENLNLRDKNILMNGFLIAVLVPTFYTAGAFVHESQTSWSGGEIHWHADFEVIAENENGELERLNLIDPKNYCNTYTEENPTMCALNDRTGSTEYHEHNDQRIHLEGVFREREDATLSAFFEAFQGSLSPDRIEYPTNDGWFRKETDGNKTIKIIVNKGVGGNREWTVIQEPSDYVISPYKRGETLDDVFIIYDSWSEERALQDLKQDDNYRGFGLLKSGEGF